MSRKQLIVRLGIVAIAWIIVLWSPWSREADVPTPPSAKALGNTDDVRAALPTRAAPLDERTMQALQDKLLADVRAGADLQRLLRAGLDEGFPSAHRYGNFLHTISRGIKKSRRTLTADERAYAFAFLDRELTRMGEDLPLATHRRLADSFEVFLLPPDRARPDADWPQRRQRFAQILIDLIARARRVHDPAWDPQDPKNTVYVNVPPPAGIPGFSGMSPDAIEDPAKRKQYEDAIAENGRRMARAREQRAAAEILRRVPYLCVGDIIGHYERHPPRRRAELEAVAASGAFTGKELDQLHAALRRMRQAPK